MASYFYLYLIFSIDVNDNSFFNHYSRYSLITYVIGTRRISFPLTLESFEWCIEIILSEKIMKSWSYNHTLGYNAYTISWRMIFLKWFYRNTSWTLDYTIIRLEIMLLLGTIQYRDDLYGETYTEIILSEYIVKSWSYNSTLIIFISISFIFQKHGRKVVHRLLKRIEKNVQEISCWSPYLYLQGWTIIDWYYERYREVSFIR